MRISVICEDRTVVIDGKAENFDLGMDANIWAIQWHGDTNTGHIEYCDSTPNQVIDSFSKYEYLIPKHKEEKIKREELLKKQEEEQEGN